MVASVGSATNTMLDLTNSGVFAPVKAVRSQQQSESVIGCAAVAFGHSVCTPTLAATGLAGSSAVIAIAHGASITLNHANSIGPSTRAELRLRRSVASTFTSNSLKQSQLRTVAPECATNANDTGSHCVSNSTRRPCVLVRKTKAQVSIGKFVSS